MSQTVHIELERKHAQILAAPDEQRNSLYTPAEQMVARQELAAALSSSPEQGGETVQRWLIRRCRSCRSTQLGNYNEFSCAPDCTEPDVEDIILVRATAQPPHPALSEEQREPMTEHLKRPEVPEEAYRLAEGAVTHGDAVAGGEADPGVLAELAVDAAAALLRAQGVDLMEKRLLGGDFPERLETAICKQERQRVREAKAQIKALRVYNDEEIAAKRGAMEGWVRIDDVLAALESLEDDDG